MSGKHVPRRMHGTTFTLIVKDEHVKLLDIKETPLDKLDAALKKLDEKLK